MIGKGGKSAVATLVERTSRMLVLVPLSGRDALTVGDAVIAAAGTLPPQIARSLTWDCGSEMAGHARVTAARLQRRRPSRPMCTARCFGTCIDQPRRYRMFAVPRSVYRVWNRRAIRSDTRARVQR